MTLRRAQKAHDRAALIADLDAARAQAVDLTGQLDAVQRGLTCFTGPDFDQAMAIGRLIQELSAADTHEPADALDAIRERTAGGAR